MSKVSTLQRTGAQSSDVNLASVYVENYLDCIDNLPNDIQRLITRIHEVDVVHRNRLKDVVAYREAIVRQNLTGTALRKALYKMEQGLIAMQEIGDQKVDLWQQIADLVDSRARSLEQDRRNLDYNRSAEPVETPKEERKEPAPSSASAGSNPSTAVNNGLSATEKSNGNGASNQATERSSKRPRRSRNDVEANDSPLPESRASQSATSTNSAVAGTGGKNSASSTSGSATGSAKAANNTTSTTAKKKKRKSRQREETPPREEEVQHEIDEPTYCLCDQISYGEMILCDNDLCPIEWFHFVCVSLTTKPKGRWFCPKCRGDRPNVMKPKSQFLKELEKYNKEKEEKA
ncbi:unnamed protein product [Nesidiocoris tenuis]|uniref:Inhibitor of growth protein n=1 Tax=Nesidiocoris tenuis TaxID=355587 RepID=A0A6H5GWW3_9HEMI|nr:unnamed protein product [Nesidiocoris tenuis]